MSTNRPNRLLPLLTGFGLGAALMYFIDPRGGARRRALIRDRTSSALRSGQEEFRRRASDVKNRVSGKVAEARSRMHEEDVIDDQLIARVRSRLGHRVAHAGAVEVFAKGGVVTLRGQALRDELDELLATVRRVRGVKEVRNELEVHDAPSRSPSLQD